ncbi:aminotransferase class I/II-fold pyridoxal phosphate-dependent enzyme [Streptomyces sp. NBC_01077]|uniref:aminotransferase class I/II-fold pyridoxal phosphate-dependent enzyme n=1 Tax=Streptomyces sp. NBC_01077 TaxID=2903746 RepID=UPI003862E656|nr:aminotransferase class I/II-fold pyridoxal phosphate-dependent enzyme [Streptomyces sp. NBC_01077]WSV43704.1 aminotransferase class I/II-fold pyridoxal phosphate-dependent enzyme [Streptomyces sp. NBC_01077]
MPSYRPIPNPKELANTHGLGRVVKLDTNEVPFGPLPGITETVARVADDARLYPDLSNTALITQLARQYEIDPSTVAVGNGSVALIEALIKGITRPGEEVLHSQPAFEAYPLVTTVAGAVSVTAPRNKHAHDLDALLTAVTSRTRIIIICNPSNPTGTYIPLEEFERFLDLVPRNILVIADEAYIEFVTPPPQRDSTTLPAKHPNLVVMRSFSKAWGLAALRVGWLCAHRTVTANIRKCITPFSVNAVAQAAAIAALHQAPEMRRRAAQIALERDSMIKELRRLLPGIPDSQGNFFWMPLGPLSARFASSCEQQGYVVRSFGDYGVRVTIGLPEDNVGFLRVAEDLLN